MLVIEIGKWGKNYKLAKFIFCVFMDWGGPKLQNFRRVMFKFLLYKFRQCEAGYSEQSKPCFEFFTIAW